MMIKADHIQLTRNFSLMLGYYLLYQYWNVLELLIILDNMHSSLGKARKEKIVPAKMAITVSVKKQCAYVCDICIVTYT